MALAAPLTLLLLSGVLAWQGARLWHWLLLAGPVTAVTLYSWLPAASATGLLVSFCAVLLPLAIRDVRRPWVVRRFFERFRQATERARLPRQLPGLTVWWEAELLSGLPQWDRFDALPPPATGTRALPDSRQGDPTTSPEIRAFVIPASHGGFGATRLELADWIMAQAARSPSRAMHIGELAPWLTVGPGPLISRLGTRAQRDGYLPRLASGELSAGLLLPARDADQPTLDSLISGTALICQGISGNEYGIGLTVACSGDLLLCGAADDALMLAFVQVSDPDGLAAQAGILPGCQAVLLETTGSKSGDHYEAGDQFVSTAQVLGSGRLSAVDAIAATLHQAGLVQPLLAAMHHRDDAQSAAAHAAALSSRLAAYALDLGEQAPLSARLTALLNPQAETRDPTTAPSALRLPAPRLWPAAKGESTAAPGAAELAVASPLIRLRLEAAAAKDDHAALAHYDQAMRQMMRRQLQLAVRCLLPWLTRALAGQSQPAQGRIALRAARLGLLVNSCYNRLPLATPHPAIAAQVGIALSRLQLMSASLWRMPGALPSPLDRATLEALREQALAECDDALARATRFAQPVWRRWLLKALITPPWG